MRTRSRVVACLTFGSLLAAAPVASQLVPIGAEFQVNAYTTNAQLTDDVAGNDSGFVVVFESGLDGSSFSITRRLFSSSGSPIGGDFVVNDYTVGPQFSGRAAMSGSGFVVVWSGSPDLDGQDYGVFARRFTSAGTPVGGDFEVNVFTLADQNFPDVAMDPAGSFVVVWQSTYGDYDGGGVFGRRFSSAGSPLASEFLANSFFTGAQRAPAVASDEQGFVVVWRSDGQDGNLGGIFGRLFDSAGVAQAAEFQASTLTMGDQTRPAVAKNGAGFLVAWEGDDGVDRGVFARKFDTAGTPQASEFRVNASLSNDEVLPQVAARAGAFVVTWADQLPANQFEIRGRSFDATGLPTSGDVRLDVFGDGEKLFGPVSPAGSGFVVVWRSLGGQDGSGEGSFGRRIALHADFDIDGNGVVDPLTDGLLALRYAFGFRGATLINGAVGAGCTRCDAPSIEAYVAGKI